MPNGYNHIALATRDLAATHRFYTEIMGFSLATVVAAPTPPAPGASESSGWARHVFYDCGNGQYMAFWDIHDPAITVPPSDLSASMGLPVWVNHLAWDSPDEAAFDERLQHWRSNGITVAEIDHGFCRSIYTTDPNGIMVEFCLMTRALDANDAAKATVLLEALLPELEAGEPALTIHHAIAEPVPA